jgi:hypothetical protein
MADVDWSQFTPAAAQTPASAPAPDDVDWSQFQPATADDPRGTSDQAGPPMADFSGARGGSTSIPLAQFDTPWQRVAKGAREIADNLTTGTRALIEGGDYETAPDDPRRVMSPVEGFGRRFAEDVTGMARLAYDYGTPVGVTTQLAETFGAPKVDPFRMGLEAQEKAVAVNPETMRYQSPRTEAAATALADVVSGYMPTGEAARAARAVDELIAPEARAIMDTHPAGRELAASGQLGPDAQGAALADDITASSGLGDAAVSARTAAEVDAAASRAIDVPPAAAEPVPEAPAVRAEAPPETAAETPEATDVTPEELAAFQRQQQVETPEATPEELAAFERQRAQREQQAQTEPVDAYENNASGESSASLEAINRGAEEKALGRTMAVIEPNGEVRPLLGVDSADVQPRPGQVIVQRGLDYNNPERWTIRAQADNLPPRLAKMRMDAARERLDALHAEVSAPPEAPHATTVRSDQGPAGIGREARIGGEADRGGNVQRAPSEGFNAHGTELRGAREAPRARVADEPVRQVAPATTERVTGIKHAKVAEERALKGMDEVQYEGKRSFGDAWDTARKKLDETPSHGESLAHSVIDRPRALNAEESAVLIQDRARLHNEHRAAMADVAQAIEAKDLHAETVARGRLKGIEEAIEVNDRASRASGHEQGFGLAARRLMSREDYSMAEVVTRAKVAKGSAITGEERKALETVTKRLEEVEARLAQVEARKPGRRAATTHEQEFSDLTEKLKSIKKEKHVICTVK